MRNNAGSHRTRGAFVAALVVLVAGFLSAGLASPANAIEMQQIQKYPTLKSPKAPLPPPTTVYPSTIDRTPTPPPPSKKVFISSQLYTGNLGGLSGGDFKCQQLASAAGLTGTYKAWIGGIGATINSRITPGFTFTQSEGPYVRVDGKVVADNWFWLMNAPLQNPIVVDEKGQLIPTGSVEYNGYTPVWTGLYLASQTVYASQDSCSGYYNQISWANDYGGQHYGSNKYRIPIAPDSYCAGGIVGEATAINNVPISASGATWSGTPYFRMHCHNKAHLYCFEQ